MKTVYLDAQKASIEGWLALVDESLEQTPARTQAAAHLYDVLTHAETLLNQPVDQVVSLDEHRTALAYAEQRILDATRAYQTV
jgi:hypothetical protein